VDKRYGALRVTARIFQIIGIIVAIITLIAVIVSCIGFAVSGANIGRYYRDFGWRWPGAIGGTAAAIIGAVVGILYGGITALFLYATGEAILVLLAMEENTRATAHLLRQAGTPPPAAPPAEIQPLEER
jgi:hypothetical protein